MSKTHETGSSTLNVGAATKPGFGCEAHDLKSILNGIADQIADADRRHSAVLSDMQSRLGALTGVTQGMREQLPPGMSQELDRIESSMAALSEKLADADQVLKSEAATSHEAMAAVAAAVAINGGGVGEAGHDGAEQAPAPLKSVLSTDGLGSLTRREDGGRNAGKPEVDRFDVVDFDEPWDEVSAEALTKLYESPDAQFSKLTEEDVAAKLAAADAVESAGTDAPVSRTAAVGVVGALVGSLSAGQGNAGLGDPRMGDVGHGAAVDNQPADSVPPSVSIEQEREWLESRFADIAARLDKSLVTMQHDGAVSELNSRFSKLEESLTAAMAGAATRDDLSGLKNIETQVEDLTAQLVTVQTHFSRLDTIELELRSLVERISDERLAKLFEDNAAKAPDMSEVADAVANRVAAHMPEIESSLRMIAERVSEEKLGAVMGLAGSRQPSADDMARLVAERLAPQLAAPAASVDVAGAERLDELRALVNDFVNERRHGDEQTNTMLDTMQQAMIRLLDRMDSLETGQSSDEEMYADLNEHPEAGDLEQLEREPVSYRRQANGPDIPVDEPMMPDRRREPSLAGSTVVAEAAAGSRLAGSAAQERTTLRIDTPVGGKVDSSAAVGGSDTVGVAAVSREDFIAAARRAARQAAAAKPALDEPTAEAVEEVAAVVADKGKVKKNAKRARSPSGLTIALACLIAAGIGFAAFKTTLMNGAQELAGRSGPAVQIPAAIGKGGAVEGKPGENGGNTGSKPALKDADDELKGKSSLVPGQVPTFGYNEAIIAPASVGSGANELPPIDGAAALAVASRRGQSPIDPLQGQMRSAEKADGADGRTAVDAVPAALTKGDVNTSGNVAGPGSATAAPASLPPATIGPYSLRHAASKGLPSAQFEVASRFAEGKGVQQNLKEAVVWYQRAASKGYAPAQYRLASMYERGFGVSADAERAKLWYQRAAEQGVVKAMHNLAVLSSGRGGTAPNYDVATRWFTQAADHGLMDSQFNLAIMYDSGLGVRRDPAAAYKWFSIAARAGDAEASRRRDSIRTKLSAAQIKALDTNIQDWRPKSASVNINDMRLAGEAWKKAE